MIRMHGKSRANGPIKILSFLLAIAIVPLFVSAQNGKGGPQPIQNNAIMNGDFRFEVVSLKPSRPDEASVVSSEPSLIGFKSTNVNMWQIIMEAYNPEHFNYWIHARLLNAPGWVTKDSYDIEGRVNLLDLLKWHNQSPTHELLRSALQAALRERCHLALHQIPSDRPGLDLVVSEKGLRIKESTHPATPPHSAVKFSDGGGMAFETVNGRKVRHFYNATMQDLAQYLTVLSPFAPVLDKTGLSGRYDFVLSERDSSEPMTDEFGSALSQWPIDKLGLKLRKSKAPGFTLVIDHIDKPSPN